jgi:hypothetical protein
MDDEQHDATVASPSHAHKRSGPVFPKTKKQKQQRFIEVFSETANIKYSCRAAGIDRRTFYRWKENDEAFRKLYENAEPEADDTLEYAAYLRAVEGIEEPMVSMGKVIRDDVGEPMMVRKYSDQLLITLLKARMPQKYKDKPQVEVNTSMSANLQSSQAVTIDTRRLSDEQLADLKTFAQKLKDTENGTE